MTSTDDDAELLKRNAELMAMLGPEARDLLTASDDSLDSKSLVRKNKALESVVRSGTATREDKTALLSSGQALLQRTEEHRSCFAQRQQDPMRVLAGSSTARH